jgi:hypothetical protein
MLLTPNYTFLYQTVASWRRRWGLMTSLYLAMFLVVLMRCWDSYAVGLLKLAVLVHVHACTQQIILVFVCGMYPL